MLRFTSIGQVRRLLVSVLSSGALAALNLGQVLADTRHPSGPIYTR